MPITASAQKALRQSIKRRAKNLARSNAYKLAIKELKKASQLGGSQAKELLSKAYQAVDKAAKRGVIKANKASRLKSSASRLLIQKTK